MARHVLVNMPSFFAAIHGLKYAAAPRPIQRFLFRPGGVSAVQITEFHVCCLSFPGGWSSPFLRENRFDIPLDPLQTGAGKGRLSKQCLKFYIVHFQEFPDTGEGGNSGLFNPIEGAYFLADITT